MVQGFCFLELQLSPETPNNWPKVGLCVDFRPNCKYDTYTWSLVGKLTAASDALNRHWEQPILTLNPTWTPNYHDVLMWEFPKIRVPYFGVLIIRILLY